jgi:hypothetical protein
MLRSRPKQRAIYVIAGNRREFDEYLKIRSIRPDRAKYVSGIETLAGVTPYLNAVATGTCFKRDDWRDISHRLTELQAKLRHDPHDFGFT